VEKGGNKVSIWKNPTFVQLFSARLLSNAGDSLYAIATMWLVHQLGGSTFYTGLAGFLVLIPNALQMFFGPIVERLPIKKTFVSTQLTQAIVVLFIPIVAHFNWLTVEFLLVIMPLLALMNQLVFPMESALLPVILEKEQLVKGNTAFSFAFHGMELVFTTIAGLLIATFGATTILLADAVIFLAAMLIFSMLKLPIERLNMEKQESSFGEYGKQLKEGLHIVFRSLFFVAALGGLIANFAFGMVNGVLPDYADHRGGASVYGFYLAALSFGILIGTLFASTIERFPLGKVAVFSFAGSAALWASAIYVPNTYASLILLVFSLLPIGATNVVMAAIVQSVVPTKYLARVSTVLGSVSVGAMPLGSLIAGVLALKIGSTHVLASPALGLLFIAFFWLLIPRLWKLPKSSEIQPEDFGLNIENPQLDTSTSI
jgi:MFS family permease